MPPGFGAVSFVGAPHPAAAASAARRSATGAAGRLPKFANAHSHFACETPDVFLNKIGDIEIVIFN